jgi:hypothetical protein
MGQVGAFFLGGIFLKWRFGAFLKRAFGKVHAKNFLPIAKKVEIVFSLSFFSFDFFHRVFGRFSA